MGKMGLEDEDGLAKDSKDTARSPQQMKRQEGPCPWTPSKEDSPRHPHFRFWTQNKESTGSCLFGQCVDL